MLSSDRPKYKLYIGSGSDYRFVTRITVFDSRNQKVQSDRLGKTLEYELFKGLYTIRIELNGKSVDEVISLNGDTQVVVRKPPMNGDWTKAKTIALPQLYSSAPLINSNYKDYYATSFDYYTRPAIQHSRSSTLDIAGAKNEKSGSIFIFLRFPNEELYQKYQSSWGKPFHSYFRLLDDNGVELCDLSDETKVKLGKAHGWVALNVDVSPGLYFLSYVGKNERMIPIYIYKNWHTQVFMTLADEPKFGSLRIFLARNKDFNPDDTNNQYIDIFLDKLQNNTTEVEDELIEFAAYNKFESPMLALLCAYIYLNGSSTRNDALVGQMIYNLNQLILKGSATSPDLRALEILSARHFGNEKYSKSSISGIPTFRFGFEIIRKASVKYSGLIAKHSYNDYLSEVMYYDSPFTTFKPIGKIKSEFKSNKKKLFNSVRLDDNNVFKIVFDELPSQSIGFTDYIKSEESFDVEQPVARTIGYTTSWNNPKKTKTITELFGMETVKYFIAENQVETETGSWLTGDIADQLNKNENITVKELSEKLKVSGNTITRILEDYSKRSREDDELLFDTVK